MQLSIFAQVYDTYKSKKPLRLIELFAGYGSQALALKYMGVPFEHYRVCEWNWKSNYAYSLMHDLYQEYNNDMTKDEIIKALQGKGLSADWNKPTFTCMGGGGKTPKMIMNKKLMETLRENELGEDVKAFDLYNKKAQDNLPTLMLPNYNSIALWNGYAVRKLTPRECFRLMGVRDEDFDKIKDKFSDSTLYHLAGDSIVTTVLMAVLAPMFDKEEKFDYKDKECEK